MGLNPDYQTRIYNIYNSQKQYLDSPSKIAFRCFFADLIDNGVCTVGYKNVVELTKFVTTHYQTISIDPAHAMNSNALETMYHAIVNVPPSHNLGTSNSFYRCTKAFKVDGGMEVLDDSGNPIIELVVGPVIASGIINNFGNKVQTGNCLHFGSSQNDLIGSIDGITCKEYATQVDAIGACEAAMWMNQG